MEKSIEKSKIFFENPLTKAVFCVILSIEREGVINLYNKSKLNAIRFFLAQSTEDGLIVRDKVINLRSFRTEAAEKLFNDPFSTGTKEVYVLEKICEWADIILPEDWDLYATPNGVKELAKAVLKKPHGSPEVTTYEQRRAVLQQCKKDFFERNNLNV